MTTSAATLFGTSTALAFTGFPSLATSANRLVGATSAAVDVSAITNPNGPPIDIMLGGAFKTSASALTASFLELWLAGSEDGTNYAGGLTAAGTPTLTAEQKNLLMPLGQFATNTSISTIYQISPISLAKAMGGFLPRKFLIFATQSTGQALVAGSALTYTSISYQSA